MNMIAIIVFKFLEVLCRLLRFFVAWLIISLPFFWLLCVADGSPHLSCGRHLASTALRARRLATYQPGPLNVTLYKTICHRMQESLMPRTPAEAGAQAILGGTS